MGGKELLQGKGECKVRRKKGHGDEERTETEQQACAWGGGNDQGKTLEVCRDQAGDQNV